MTLASIQMASSAAAAPAGGAATQAIGDQFLKLLVAQLKNQDPMSPMDPTAMTGQLTQLSSLTQLTNISDGIAKLTGASGTVGSLLSQASSSLGKTAQFALSTQGGVSFADHSGSIHYDFGTSAPYQAQLIETDASGSVIGAWPVAGATGDVGVGPVSSGAVFRVEASYANGVPDASNSGSAMLTQNMNVKSIAIQGGAAYLVDAGGNRAAWSSVVGLN
jgi:flagellar basal-body rod modification protein FlgD